MSGFALEVADVVRQHGAAFLNRYGAILSGGQRRALRAIELCRTSALGGHKTRCDHCGHEGIAYNPCRNRSCPKCHGAARTAWLAKQQRDVLDTAYVHAVFTLPADLKPLVFQNAQVLYSLLFRSVGQTLLDIGGDPRHLGAELGGLAVLHTWGGQLQYHPHLHCVLPAGGLAPDYSRWVASRPNFFLPVRVLSRRFRTLYLQGLKALYDAGQLAFSGTCQDLTDAKSWSRLLQTLREKEWVVYAKEPMPNPQHVLKYLARYTHRVAIANSRLVALQYGQVTFRFKDHKRQGRLRTQTLDAIEFLRRFTLHVLPRGLHKIRYFGFMANRHRQIKLATCRHLIASTADRPVTGATVTDVEVKSVSEDLGRHGGEVCRVCRRGRMQLAEAFYRHRAAWDLSVAVPQLDTS